MDIGDKLKIIDIQNWGVLNVGDSNAHFMGCSNLQVSATDPLNLSGSNNLDLMFRSAYLFNGDIGNWDTSNVRYMSNMFRGASFFNQDLNSWNVSLVTDMGNMFNSASVFNGSISSWNTSKVNNMASMFYLANDFNQNLSSWNVSSITIIPNNCDNFNLNTPAWVSPQPTFISCTP
jgi:surface protein